MVGDVTILPSFTPQVVTIPGPPSLDQVTPESLKEEVRAQLFEQTYEFLQYLNMPMPEGSTSLTYSLATRLEQAHVFATKGFPAPVNLPGLMAELRTLLYQSAVPQQAPGAPEDGPWALTDTEPRTELECVLRACLARTALYATEHIPIGRLAALASLPINTMRVYARRYGLREAMDGTPAAPKGHVLSERAIPWLRYRGIEGPPITKE